MRTHSCFVQKFFLGLFFVFCTFLSVLLTQASFAYANSKYAGIVMDAKTGRVLYSYKANATRYPASLTKMMTLYLMFEALEQGKITQNTRIKMSKHAASMPPSKLGIKPGRTLTVKQAIYALVTKSANDVAAAVAEHLGGSERNFAVRMTKRARQLGMSRTTFRNASGLTAKGQITSAKDMALLGIALREHYPQYYRYFSTRIFKYGKRKYGNHNHLLRRVKGVDGVKTGYTQLSGFNLVSSAQLKKRSIVAVVLGGKSKNSRDAQMQKLIARYLKKATRRKKRTLLVAKIITPRRSSTLLAQAINLPARGPLPLFKTPYTNFASRRIEQAHTPSIAYVSEMQPSSRENIDAIRNKLIAMSDSPFPVLKTESTSTPDDSITTSAIVSNSTHPSSPTKAILEEILVKKPVSAAMSNINSEKAQGWQVQVGAVPNRSRALLLLSEVRKKIPHLSNAKRFGKLKNYLEHVTKNDQLLYRARFAGFLSKKSARLACSIMKKRKVSCLAIKS